MSDCCSGTSCGCCCESDVIGQLTSKLTFNDILGTWKARWGINRMNYIVAPGLYRLGTPTADSHVFVTGNYKMSLDCLRKSLDGIDAWILVLDTKGINVWCAAGKGTFGTEEIVIKINQTKLAAVINHKNIILPQLGAVGVEAHEVKKETGFNVIYGPVRAEDIKSFLSNDLKADTKMRTVRFNAIDRAVLAPMEIVGAAKPTFFTLGILMLTNAFGLTKINGKDVKAYVGSVLVGTVLVPVFLPAIPVRSFSLKGAIAGLLWALLISKKNGLLKGTSTANLKLAQYMLILPSVSAIFAFNFTGSSTYTSMSGVQKEIKTVMPLIGISLFAGILLMIKSAVFSKEA